MSPKCEIRSYYDFGLRNFVEPTHIIGMQFGM